MNCVRFMWIRFHPDFDRSSLWNSFILSSSSSVCVLLRWFLGSVSNSPSFCASMVPWKALWLLLQEYNTWELWQQKPFSEHLVGADCSDHFIVCSLALSQPDLCLTREFIWKPLLEITSLVLTSFRKGCVVVLGLRVIFAGWCTLPNENHPEVRYSRCAM